MPQVLQQFAQRKPAAFRISHEVLAYSPLKLILSLGLCSPRPHGRRVGGVFKTQHETSLSARFDLVSPQVPAQLRLAGL